MVSNCTFHENGEKVYNTLEEYNSRSDDDIAFNAASALAEMMYSMDQNYEEKLPENKFLKQFKFVNEELSLVDQAGDTVDTSGRKIDGEGRYLNEDGHRVDVEGNLLDEDGNYIPKVTYLDDDGNPMGLEETDDSDEPEESNDSEALEEDDDSTEPQEEKQKTTRKANG